MKKENNVLMLVIMIFLIIFFSICVFIDSQNGNKESVTSVYLSLINVVVMGILTYLLLETSQKNNEINENLAFFTKSEYRDRKIKELEIELSVIEKYINLGMYIRRVFLPYINILSKLDMLLELRDNELPINEYLFNIDIDHNTVLPEKSELYIFRTFPDLDKTENYNTVDRLFKNSLSSAFYTQRSISEFIKTNEEFHEIFKDDFFNSYYHLSRTLNLYEELYFKAINKIIAKNDKDNKLNDLSVTVFEADQINTIMKFLLHELKLCQNNIEKQLYQLHEI